MTLEELAQRGLEAFNAAASLLGSAQGQRIAVIYGTDGWRVSAVVGSTLDIGTVAPQSTPQAALKAFVQDRIASATAAVAAAKAVLSKLDEVGKAVGP